jgi:hypothetical protein
LLRWCLRGGPPSASWGPYSAYQRICTPTLPQTVTPGAQIRMLTAAFALSGSTRLVRGMMGQQLPVGLYRSASVDGCDMVKGQLPRMNLLCNEDKRGSKGWRAKQIALSYNIGHLHTNGIICSRWN